MLYYIFDLEKQKRVGRAYNQIRFAETALKKFVFREIMLRYYRDNRQLYNKSLRHFDIARSIGFPCLTNPNFVNTLDNITQETKIEYRESYELYMTFADKFEIRQIDV